MFSNCILRKLFRKKLSTCFSSFFEVPIFVQVSKIHILYTGTRPSDKLTKLFPKHNVVIREDFSGQVDLVVASEIKRTVKFVCAVALGVPIVGPGFVEDCVAGKREWGDRDKPEFWIKDLKGCLMGNHE